MRTRLLSISVACCLVFVACGGDDDAATTTTSTTTPAPAATTPVATEPVAPTTVAPTPTTVPLVVDGATVVVANGNIVGGSAGRMTDALALAGYTTGDATNGAEKVEDSIVYYSTASGAQVVAESLALQLGGVAVMALPDPAPTESGALEGGDVLLLLGSNQADKSLAELSGTPSTDAVGSGSTIVVANANTIGGSAGRMTATLEAGGYAVGDPVNAATLLDDSIIYYNPGAEIQADAEALGAAIGVDVLAMPAEIPTEDGTLDGDILFVLGNTQADKTLAELAP